MKITPARINTLLTIGENLNIEFKRAGDGPKADTFESVCAFLNKAGGDLLLGVDDDGTVVGLPPKSVDAMIRNFVKVMNENIAATIIVVKKWGLSEKCTGVNSNANRRLMNIHDRSMRSIRKKQRVSTMMAKVQMTAGILPILSLNFLKNSLSAQINIPCKAP